MLQLNILILAFMVMFTGCESKQNEIVEKSKKEVAADIFLGDDIFVAKEKLIKSGFRIKYGPDFPTKTRKYLMMIVDYGAIPSGSERFRYTVGLEGSSKPIVGIIKATPEGKITSIE